MMPTATIIMLQSLIVMSRLRSSRSAVVAS